MKKKKQNKTLKAVLSALVVIFILLVSYFFVAQDKQTLFPFVAVLGLIFLLLGIALIVLTIKQKIKGKLKIFLMLTGISAICPFVFSILHNLFYALAVITSNIIWLKYLFEFLHAASFIIALLISPIVFLVGVIGSILLFIKKK